jgi:hypothetical protein
VAGQFVIEVRVIRRRAEWTDHSASRTVSGVDLRIRVRRPGEARRMPRWPAGRYAVMR